MGPSLDPPTCSHISASVHIHAVPAVYEQLASAPQGLSRPEAANRLERFGKNVLREAPPRPLFARLMANFTHLMALLLWVGGVIGFLAQMPQLGVAIWMVNLINGAFSFWQEFRAETATEALRAMLPANSRVLRENEEQMVPAEELVPGDVILLREGDRISADARLIEAAELRVDQSALTGESRPVGKRHEAIIDTDLPAAERANLVFAGTNVVSGVGKAVVFATGMTTEIGRIARLTQSVADTPSPLQQQLVRVTRLVSVMGAAIGLVFFGVAHFLAHVNLADSFIFAMGMIVAFVPEGMLPTVTLSLAMAVQRMARRHALVRRLSAVETLGCTTVICTDKTGTLTENQVTVTHMWLGGRRLTVTGAGYAPDGHVLEEGRPLRADQDHELRLLLRAASLCNNARLIPPDDHSSRWTILGDPTEGALQAVALKGGLDSHVENHSARRQREIPFDSRRKRMSTIHVDGDGWLVYAKGAPEELLSRCDLMRKEGKEIQLDEALRREILRVGEEYARDGRRVLALALRPLPDECVIGPPESIESDLVLLGLVAMLDPPRPDVPEAVQRCHRAGIRIVMITGDHELTAESIGRSIGLIRSPQPQLITGADLKKMTDESLRLALQGEVVFARVTPEHKLRVVETLQEMGHIVAVTGDGVNDAPALQKADIGIAMGQSGTDVAREAADMVLADDHLASIVNAVEEGRAVYANIRRFAVYVFNSNVAEAVPFVAMLLSAGRIPLPLTVMQVLAVDLGTDMVPAIGLGAEPPEADVMDRPPRSRKESLFTAPLLARAFLWYGMIEAVAGMAGYYFLNQLHGWPRSPLAPEGSMVYRAATTMTLACIVACQIGAVLGGRTDRASVFQVGFFRNPLVMVGIGVELVLLLLLVYTPLLQPVFNTAPLGPREWGFAFAWAPVMLVLDEGRKALLRRLTARGSQPWNWSAASREP